MGGSMYVFARWRLCAPPFNTYFLRQAESISQTASQSVQPFFSTAHRRLSVHFTMGPPPPSKLPLPTRDLDSRDLIHISSGPLESPTQTASRSVQTFLPGSLPSQYHDRQTDHATRSVTIGRIYVRSTAMRRNNGLFITNSLPNMKENR